MGINIVHRIEVTRQPAECTPGRAPGWYVKDRDRIIAYCDARHEADVVAGDLNALGERVAERIERG